MEKGSIEYRITLERKTFKYHLFGSTKQSTNDMWYLKVYKLTARTIPLFPKKREHVSTVYSTRYKNIMAEYLTRHRKIAFYLGDEFVKERHPEEKVSIIEKEKEILISII